MAVSIIVVCDKNSNYDVLAQAKRYKSYALVDEVIVWNQDALYLAHNTLEGVKVINCRTTSMKSWFLASCLSRQDCVILQSSELEILPGAVLCLWNAYKKDTEKLYSFKGFNYAESGDSGAVVHPVLATKTETTVDVASLHTACFNKKYAAMFLGCVDAVCYDLPVTEINEHIVFSHFFSNVTGTSPVILPIPHPAAVSFKDEPKPEKVQKLDEDVVNRCQLIWPAYNRKKQETTRSLVSSKTFLGICPLAKTFNARSEYLTVEQAHGIKYFSMAVPGKAGYSNFKLAASVTLLPNEALNLVYFFLSELPVAWRISIDYRQKNKKETYHYDVDLKGLEAGYPTDLIIRLHDLLADKETPVRIESFLFEYRSSNSFEFCFTDLVVSLNAQPD